MATETTARPRKRAAKKAAPKPEVVEEETPAKRGRARGIASWEENEDVRDTIVRLRDEEELGWAEIAEQVGINVGAAQLRYFEYLYKDDGAHGTATPELIMTDRDENGLSWGKIQAKYWISRGEAWDLYRQAGGDNFTSDIGKGGRYVTRDPEVVEARRAARAAERAANKPPSKRRSRKPKFTGFDVDTDDDTILDMVEGKKITWTRTRGGGTDTAQVKPETADIGADKRGNRTLKFNDGAKVRTIYPESITEIS